MEKLIPNFDFASEEGQFQDNQSQSIHPQAQPLLESLRDQHLLPAVSLWVARVKGEIFQLEVLRRRRQELRRMSQQSWFQGVLGDLLLVQFSRQSYVLQLQVELVKAKKNHIAELEPELKYALLTLIALLTQRLASHFMLSSKPKFHYFHSVFFLLLGQMNSDDTIENYVNRFFKPQWQNFASVQKMPPLSRPRVRLNQRDVDVISRAKHILKQARERLEPRKQREKERKKCMQGQKRSVQQNSFRNNVQNSIRMANLDASLRLNIPERFKK